MSKKAFISKKSEEKLLQELLAKFKPVPAPKYSYYGDHIYNWSSCIEHDYDHEYGDDGNGCDCGDDYCRCGRIVNVQLKDFNVIAMINDLTAGMNNEVLIYCIDRIVRLAKLTENSFEGKVVGGYYGEEFDGVHLSDELNKFLHTNISMFVGLSDIERIKYVLNAEYGHLLSEIEDTAEVLIKEISVDTIRFNDDYRKKVNILEDFYDDKFVLPRGIFLQIGNKFRLIDGYHRVMKAKSMNWKTIKGIVLK